MNVPSDWWSTFFHGAAVDLWVNALPPEYTDQETSAILRLLNAPAGGELLDVPCGHGRHALALAARGYRVVGVDSSPQMVELARERHEAVVADATALPFEDGSFDLALAYMSLMNMDDPSKARSACGRATETGSASPSSTA